MISRGIQEARNNGDELGFDRRLSSIKNGRRNDAGAAAGSLCGQSVSGVRADTPAASACIGASRTRHQPTAGSHTTGTTPASDSEKPPALRATSSCRCALGQSPGRVCRGRAQHVLSRAALLPLGWRLVLLWPSRWSLGASCASQRSDGATRSALNSDFYTRLR